MPELIFKVREAKGSDLTVEDMKMIADINRIVLNLKFMRALLIKHNSQTKA